MKDQNYVNQLERAVQVLTNSNSNWDINVSVWDRELILSILDYMNIKLTTIDPNYKEHKR